MSRRGFTLIELLVVISIIGLLLGIMLPALSFTKQLGQKANCAGQLKGVGIGLQAYLNDHNNIMPRVAVLPSFDNTYPSLAEVLSPYLGDHKALLCVADDAGRRTDLPGRRYFDTEGSSYSFNDHLYGIEAKDDFLATIWGEVNVFVIFDYEPFHRRSNYLFADGHVGDLAEVGH